MYSYYKKVEIKEQMLFDSEIARLYRIYKIQDKKDFGEVVGTPYFSLVKKIISEYIEENEIGLEELYYPTFGGMALVYPKYIYKPAIENFIENYNVYDLTQVYKSKDGKEYKFVLVKNRV
jgi:hypothetical protein